LKELALIRNMTEGLTGFGWQQQSEDLEKMWNQIREVLKKNQGKVNK
jgi:hypothetical protein